LQADWERHRKDILSIVRKKYPPVRRQLHYQGCAQVPGAAEAGAALADVTLQEAL
jgi:hypothetical protein